MDLSKDEINLADTVDCYNFSQHQHHSFGLLKRCELATMLKLKRKFHSRKRRLNSASSSTAGSVSDLEDRVVMLCEDVPTESSFDSGSQSPGASFDRGSQSEEHESGSEPHIIHLSRDRRSYRQACYVEKEPTQTQKKCYIQTVMQVYESFPELKKLSYILCPQKCLSLWYLWVEMLCACAYMSSDCTYPAGKVHSQSLCLSCLWVK